VRWLILSFGALLATHVVFAVSFGFPVHYPLYYISHLLQRQADYGAQLSYYALTRQAIRIFLNWFFCGKFIAPFLVLLIGIGAFDQMKKRIFHPILLFAPYFLFLLFIYNGRFDATYLAVATFCVPGFIESFSCFSTFHQCGDCSGYFRIFWEISVLTGYCYRGWHPRVYYVADREI
jgi:hypothetical protein